MASPLHSHQHFGAPRARRRLSAMAHLVLVHLRALLSSHLVALHGGASSGQVCTTQQRWAQCLTSASHAASRFGTVCHSGVEMWSGGVLQFSPGEEPSRHSRCEAGRDTVWKRHALVASALWRHQGATMLQEGTVGWAGAQHRCAERWKGCRHHKGR